MPPRPIYSALLSIIITPLLSAEQAERPNILLIVAEDASPDFGCYGNTSVTSPHIDKLAAEGIQFNNAYSSYSVSSPARGSLLTGLYPHQNGQMGLATHNYQMFPGIKTLPKYLKELGYITGNIGKIHVNNEADIPFDYWQIRSSNFGKKNLFDYAKKATEFINTADGEPFYLQVNFPDSHFPVQRQVQGRPHNIVEPSSIKESLPYVGILSPRIKENIANYYNCINRLDESVGMLIQALKESGQYHNTFIFFISDHGAQFSRAKVTNYEGGLKIPLLIKYPDKQMAGKQNDKLVSIIDLLPSFIDIAGGQASKELAGRSLISQLEGSTPWRRELYAGGLGSYPSNTYPKRSVRDERFKLIINEYAPQANPAYQCYSNAKGHYSAGCIPQEIQSAPKHIRDAYALWSAPPKYELYDLINDPYEWVNLSCSPQHSATLKRLQASLRQWRIETGDMIVYPEKLEQLRQEMNQLLKNQINYRHKKFKYDYLDYLRPKPQAAALNHQP